MQSLEDLSKERLINDLVKLRERVDELEKIKEEKEKHAAELAQTKAMFEGLFQFAPDAILVINGKGGITQANQEAERLFGYAREALIGLDHDIVVPDRFKERHLEERKRYQSAPHVRRMGTGVELCGRRKDGTEFPVDISLGPLQAKDEMVTLAVVRDITERKRTEVALKEHAQQLADVNKDLESFGFSISHDLRAPLRAITGYSQMIMKKEGTRFDEETRRRFQMITTNAEKMGQLIDDLLVFSRLGSQAVAKGSLDMKELAEEVWQELLAISPGREMTLEIDQMPVASGDRTLIRQVYANLLGNAVKFTWGRKPAVIEVGSCMQRGETVYYVRDNGAGFDMRFYDKLFGVFQRLHSDEEYKGTGIGLALVKRIIARHGGRIWAEGEVDRGATFYFTLPIQKD